MRMYDIIKNKRDGGKLSKEEIDFFVKGYTAGEIPDYQASALCMAIYFRGMDDEETTNLTLAIAASGDKVDLSGINGVKVDKHSTGGVGDKTSLIIAPIVASYGVKVAKMSGRGLGHTGGTIDKLEAIDGYQTSIDKKEFFRIVNEVGVSIIGQSGNLAPADKKLYALRDVTATVDSLPLIVSSIMGKKLAAGADCILLDVKTGSGGFMKTLEDSTKLAKSMVEIGHLAGKKVIALITDMDVPLGKAIRNSLEVIEAVETLKGEGPEDLTEICIDIAANMLYMAGKGTVKECEALAKKAIADGSALQTLVKMVHAQGGNEKLLLDTSLFKKAAYDYEVKAPKTGYIEHVDTESYGMASLALGAGRAKKEDPIDYSAGITLEKKTGDFVKEGDVIAVLHTNKPESVKEAEERILKATEISSEPVEKKPIILGRIER
ncbi:MAG: pyrimidine-nucleoside phosphorylase [Faecalibacterium sp.]|nr:pyrimidine-nucleoside phosphorylase [Faecalibacterium sp.]